jgi:multiple antibiotic resistance protein
VGQEPHRWPAWLLALVVAWLLTAMILLLCSRLSRLLGDNVMSALQSLMGLILTTIAIEMGLQGLRIFLAGSS